MTLRATLRGLFAQENLNFLITNRIPRRALTLFMGWFSKLEQPVIRDTSIALWKLFCEVDLTDARPGGYRSLHDCFTRALRPGARHIAQDPTLLTSPCDGIVGAMGTIHAGVVLQAKGFPYQLRDLLIDPQLASMHEGGQYLTLRLTAGMYHRFHAPFDCDVRRVTYVSGDTWNVNPIALQRIERLFCRNERAVIETQLLGTTHVVTMVPVAAVLVASMRLHFADVRLHLRYRGPNVIDCSARLARGDEMGWFEHGSTIIIFTPSGFSLLPGLRCGDRVRMGQPLLRLPGQ